MTQRVCKQVPPSNEGRRLNALDGGYRGVARIPAPGFPTDHAYRIGILDLEVAVHVCVRLNPTPLSLARLDVNIGHVQIYIAVS